MKIAIIGGTGLLGSNLVKGYFKHDCKTFSRSESKNIDSKINNVINFDNLNSELMEIFALWKPDLIINTVAIVNLQKCEISYQLAYSVNCQFAQQIAIVAKYFDSYFIQISTDHFYNDLKIKHSEEDEVDLLNNYARTKFIAEKKVLKAYGLSLIVRTNIVGFRMSYPDSFFEWLLKSIANKDNINLYSNYYTSPISVAELGTIIYKCFEKKLKGVYNISSCEVIDKFNFGIKVAQIFGYETNHISICDLKRDESNLKRAITLGLDVSKIEKALNIKMPTIDKTIQTLYKEYKNYK